MSTMINSNYSQIYNTSGPTNRQTSTSTKNTVRNSSAGYGDSASVEFSKDGLAALEANKGTESKLSAKAQDYIDTLRKQYGDYDFFVAGNSEERDQMLKKGDKDFSVVIDVDELERMANDDEYADGKIKQMESAIETAKRISKEFGYTEDGGENGTLTNLSIVLNKDGSTSFFAELEKSSAKQREQIEAAREKRAEDKKAAERKAEEKRTEEKKAESEEEQPKRISIAASSEEDLIKQLSSIDWEKA